MASKRQRVGAKKIATKGEQETKKNESKNGGGGEYEQSRDQRIKENLQRMEKLGILDLSRQLKSTKKQPTRNPPKKRATLAASGSPRRSSRVKSLPQVNYSDKEKHVRKEKVLKNFEINITEGSKPEIYTEEDEKLLGDCKTSWTTYVDGYDEDGQRIYDPYDGKSCHQCRQKTLGLHTNCCKCNLVQGQLCGDCLYTRYGENVAEANENPDWICPVCRGICNCSNCRRQKGWEPTGSIYRKVVNLGFRSVAHYLIHTRGPKANQEELAGEDPASVEKSQLRAQIEDKLEINNNDKEMAEDNKHGDSDPAYSTDDNHDEDDTDDEDGDDNDDD
ncbi:hypothetical protein RJ640_016487 [Escallonia rubra]|uniref:Zinc-finger domain-containing protein n=1 Tax=Escallonia rubra TaxID=112253 RepID=A0AA88RQZ4_9ASTE|nr:hypothetical protein RJ640_016487 [Escallonia rubra]